MNSTGDVEKAINAVKYGKVRLVIREGYVISKYDNDRHFMNKQALLQVYNIQDFPYVVKYWADIKQDCAWEDQSNDVNLGPNFHGDYNLVEKVLEVLKKIEDKHANKS